MGAVAGIGLALAAVGMGMGAVGEYRAGKAQKKLGNDYANISEFNAADADRQGEDALVRGRDEENWHRKTVKGLIGSQRAGFAGQNVDVNDGSALDIQADAAYLGELDALTIRTNAAREAWGFKTQAVSDRMQAEAYRKGGQINATEGRNRAIGTFLTQGGSLAVQAYGFKGSGPKAKQQKLDDEGRG